MADTQQISDPTQEELDALRKSLQSSPVKYLTFSGGGAKGAGYSGTFDALIELGIMNDVEGISGSSAGAISAAFIATGMSPEEFQKISAETSLGGLVGKGHKFFGLMSHDAEPLYALLQKHIANNVATYLNSINIPEICNQRLKSIEEELTKIQKQKEQFKDDKEPNNLKKVDKDYLEHQEAELQKQQSRLKGFQNEGHDSIKELKERSNDGIKYHTTINKLNGIKQEIEKIKKELDKTKSKQPKQEMQNKLQALSEEEVSLTEELKSIPNGKIFFNDLSLLRVLNPEKFKDLYITAAKVKDAHAAGDQVIKPETFDHETPNVEIALACKASAAIPLYFQPVEINGELYVDGGYLDNIPMEYFKKRFTKELMPENIDNDPVKLKKAIHQGRILAMAFGNAESAAHVAIWSAQKATQIFNPNKFVRLIMQFVIRNLAGLGGAEQYVKAEQNVIQGLKDNAQNAVVNDTKKIGTLSFSQAQKNAQYLHLRFRANTLNYLGNHEIVTPLTSQQKNQIFLMDVYDKILDQGFVGSRVISGILSGFKPIKRDDKMKQILEFSTPAKWKGQDDKTKILTEYLTLLLTKRSDGKFSRDTKSIEALIESLNTAPPEIQQNFVNVLGLEKTITKDTLHTFKKSDFDNFIKYLKYPALKQEKDAETRNINLVYEFMLEIHKNIRLNESEAKELEKSQQLRKSTAEASQKQKASNINTNSQDKLYNIQVLESIILDQNELKKQSAVIGTEHDLSSYMSLQGNSSTLNKSEFNFDQLAARTENLEQTVEKIRHAGAQEYLKEYILSILKGGTSTKAFKALIKTLNDKDTPNEIKQLTSDALGLKNPPKTFTEKDFKTAKSNTTKNIAQGL